MAFLRPRLGFATIRTRARTIGASVLSELRGKHRLPALAEDLSLPAIYSIARSFALTGGPLTGPSLCTFLKGVQEYRTLTEGGAVFIPAAFKSRFDYLTKPTGR
jgi:hypothetical protein